MELSLDDIKQELKDYFSNQTIINEYEKSNGKILISINLGKLVIIILQNYMRELIVG